MNSISSNIPIGPNPMIGLPSAWNLSALVNTGDLVNTGYIGPRFDEFQAFATSVNRLFFEASLARAQSLKATNERNIRYFQDLFSARQPSELIEAQSNLLAGVIESFTQQTRSWTELTQKLFDCGAAMIPEKAEETVEAAAAPLSADAESGGEEPLGRKTSSTLLGAGGAKLSSAKYAPPPRARKK